MSATTGRGEPRWKRVARPVSMQNSQTAGQVNTMIPKSSVGGGMCADVIDTVVRCLARLLLT
ncbi:MAG: hypothetical protein ACU85V_00410 [Gammaproteobacteria bacterium]